MADGPNWNKHNAIVSYLSLFVGIVGIGVMLWIGLHPPQPGPAPVTSPGTTPVTSWTTWGAASLYLVGVILTGLLRLKARDQTPLSSQQGPVGNVEQGSSNWPVTVAVLAGVCIVLAMLAWSALPGSTEPTRKDHSVELTKLQTIVQPSENKIPQPILPPPFDSQTVLPDGRTIISSSPEDLQTAIRTKTIEQFNRLLGGKWIKITGKMKENYGNGQVSLIHESNLMREYNMIILKFGKGWSEQLSVLPRGSALTIRGKVVPVDSSFIMLAECELL